MEVNYFLTSRGHPPVQADLRLCLDRSGIRSRHTCVGGEDTVREESGSSLRGAICQSAFWQKENIRRERVKEAVVCSPKVLTALGGFQLSPSFCFAAELGWTGQRLAHRRRGHKHKSSLQTVEIGQNPSV